MEAISLAVYNMEGKEVENIKLNASVFDGVVNEAAIYQAINAYRANQRKGLASTKTMGEVSGGGRKPWKQKGTGRARVGSIRSPLWRHGGVIFGPHPRDYSYCLPKKIKSLALKSALNSKVKENNFMVLENFTVENGKTKDALKIFSRLKIPCENKKKNYNILLLLDKPDEKTKRSLHNIGFLDFNLARDTQCYEVLTHKTVLITKKGLNELTDRLKK